MTTTKKRKLNCSADYTASFRVAGKTRNGAFVRCRRHQKTPCFICLKQSHPDAFTRPHVVPCCSSAQIGKQHKRSAGELPAGCCNMLVCRRTSVAQSPCLIPHRSPLLLLSLLTHIYHLLISLSISPTSLIPLSFRLSLTFCQLVGLPPPPTPSSLSEACLTFSLTPPPSISCTSEIPVRWSVCIL